MSVMASIIYHHNILNSGRGVTKLHTHTDRASVSTTYLCEESYVFSSVPLCVCLSIYLQISSKCYGQILMEFSGNIDNHIRNIRLNFGGDLDHCLSPGIFFFRIFIIAVRRHTGVVGLGGGMSAPNYLVLTEYTVYILFVYDRIQTHP